jgi:hypothetical protein
MARHHLNRQIHRWVNLAGDVVRPWLAKGVCLTRAKREIDPIFLVQLVWCAAFRLEITIAPRREAMWPATPRRIGEGEGLPGMNGDVGVAHEASTRHRNVCLAAWFELDTPRCDHHHTKQARQEKVLSHGEVPFWMMPCDHASVVPLP